MLTAHRIAPATTLGRCSDHSCRAPATPHPPHPRPGTRWFAPLPGITSFGCRAVRRALLAPPPLLHFAAPNFLRSPRFCAHAQPLVLFQRSVPSTPPTAPPVTSAAAAMPLHAPLPPAGPPPPSLEPPSLPPSLVRTARHLPNLQPCSLFCTTLGYWDAGPCSHSVFFSSIFFTPSCAVLVNSPAARRSPPHPLP